ncbi:MAG: hypothetical protein HYX90_08885 [Chloroflexi bacterium]|nr:hypothetical protein [Chloroflexota bacterium]
MPVDTEFKSLSAAGMAITGKSCNGWAFWSVQTTEAAPASEQTPAQPAQAETAAPAETTTERTEAPAPATMETEASDAVAATEPEALTVTNGVRNRIFRVPNQKGTPEGQTKWYCEACMKSFLAATGETPTTCPRGHRAG